MKYVTTVILLLFCFTFSFAQKEGEMLLKKKSVVLGSGSIISNQDGIYYVPDSIVDVINSVVLGDSIKNGTKQKGDIFGYTYDTTFSFMIKNSIKDTEGLHPINFAEFKDSLVIKVGDFKWILKETPKNVLCVGKSISLKNEALLYDTLRHFYYLDTHNGNGKLSITHFDVKADIRLFINNEEVPLKYNNDMYKLPSERVIGINDSVVIDAGIYQWRIYPYSEPEDKKPETNYLFWIMLIGDAIAVLAAIVLVYKRCRKITSKKHEKKKEIEEAKKWLDSLNSDEKRKEINLVSGSEEENNFDKLLNELSEKINDKSIDGIRAAKAKIDEFISNLKVIGGDKEGQSSGHESTDISNEPKVNEQNTEVALGSDNSVVANGGEVSAETVEIEETKENEQKEVDLIERIAKLIEKATDGKVQLLQELKEEKEPSFDGYIRYHIDKSTRVRPSTVGKFWDASKDEKKGESIDGQLEHFVIKLDEEIRKTKQLPQKDTWDYKATFSEIYSKLSQRQKDGFGIMAVQEMKRRKLKGNDESFETFCKSLLETQNKADSIKADEDVLRDCVNKDTIPEDVKDALAIKFVIALNERIKEESHRLESNDVTLESLFKELLEKHIEVPHLVAEVEEKALELSKEKIQMIQNELDKKNDECNMLNEKMLEREKEYEVVTRKKNEEIKAAGLKALNDLEEARNTYLNNKMAMENKHKDELGRERQKLEAEKISHKQELKKLQSLHEKELEEQKRKAEKSENDAVKKISDDKNEMERQLNNKIDDLSIDLTNEKIAHEHDVDNFKVWFLNYIDDIQEVISLAVNAIKESANDTHSDKLRSFVNERIMKNDELGMESFFVKLTDVVNKSEMKSIDEFKEGIKSVLLECFDSDRPTWLDILTRLYLYSKANFVACQFVDNGLDLCEVGAAFHTVETLLSRFKIDLVYPELFEESFDSDKYEDRALRDIDSYVDGIASHVNASDSIVDLYKVGYKTDGLLQKKPIVSSFS